ncbi:hypothetical protein JOM56_001706 [Amanita muscaria]
MGNLVETVQFNQFEPVRTQFWQDGHISASSGSLEQFWTELRQHYSEVPDSEGEDQAAEATRMKNLKRAKENTGRGSKTCDILVASKTGIRGRLAEPYKPYQTGEALQGTTSLQGSTWPEPLAARPTFNNTAKTVNGELLYPNMP